MRVLRLIGKWVLDLMYKLISRTFVAYLVHTIVWGLLMITIITTESAALIGAPWMEALMRWQGIITLLFIAGCFAPKIIKSIFDKGVRI